MINAFFIVKIIQTLANSLNQVITCNPVTFSRFICKKNVSTEEISIPGVIVVLSSLTIQTKYVIYLRSNVQHM